MTDNAKPVNALLRAILTAACLAGFAVMLELVLSGNASVLDGPIRNWFYGMRSDCLNSIVTCFTHLGDWYAITIICIVFLAVKPTRIRFGVPLAAGSVFATLLRKVIKHLVERPRPSDISHLIVEHGYSFPSGHAISSMFLFAMLIWFIIRYVRKRQLKVILSTLAAIPMIGIGLSRIYCGVHYPTDVFAGWLLGLAVMIITTWIIEYVVSHSSRNCIHTD
ncbi:MAG: phosphatase PAP2 family protein [Clostridia bacterium]|nr:phosphatase PAP2 family protein [Clostridia bacterium]